MFCEPGTSRAMSLSNAKRTRSMPHSASSNGVPDAMVSPPVRVVWQLPSPVRVWTSDCDELLVAAPSVSRMMKLVWHDSWIGLVYTGLDRMLCVRQASAPRLLSSVLQPGG